MHFRHWSRSKWALPCLSVAHRLSFAFFFLLLLSLFLLLFSYTLRFSYFFFFSSSSFSFFLSFFFSLSLSLSLFKQTLSPPHLTQLDAVVYSSFFLGSFNLFFLPSLALSRWKLFLFFPCFFFSPSFQKQKRFGILSYSCLDISNLVFDLFPYPYHSFREFFKAPTKRPSFLKKRREPILTIAFFELFSSVGWFE